MRTYLADGGTEHLRATASAFVDAREHFFTKDGDPDWRGQTFAYRRWVRETLFLAGVQAADMTRVQGSIRWHTGALLRAKLSPEQIEDLGLREVTPAQRSVEKRSRQSEVLGVFSAGEEISDPEAILSALHLASVGLRRLSTEAVQAAPASSRKEIRAAAEAVYTRTEELLAASGRRK